MVVNGTEDVALEWDAIDWRLHEDNVGRLRRRIFKAAKEKDLAKVRSLQKMMLRSWSNTLVSVRQVTQRNTGRGTAGIDGEVALTAPARMALAVRVHRSIRTWKPLPVKRVYVPKANAKLRPLGIPVLMDRCHQTRAKNALEPEWEARFEPRSYGFRPGRSCQDAIEAIYDTCKGRGATRVWTLDADLAAAFDKLDHSHLMSAIGSFPGREMIRAWLKAGVFEPGKGFAPTEEGSPQGGVISPCLLNVALHGLEEAAGVRYGPDGIRIATGSPVLVRYCDDFVVCCHTRQQAEQVKARLAGWLAPRGLTFNEEKTRVVSLEAGYDFLGFNIRRYRNGKLLIKPSKAAIRRVKHKLAEQMRRLRGQNASAVLAAICPVTRGWASFYPVGGIQADVQHRGRLLVEAHLQVGLPQPPPKAEALDHQTVLRPVQPLQAQQLGLRRRRQRRLPAPAGLDPHHPAPQGHRPGVPRRPRPDRLLEPAARQEPAPARPQQPAPAEDAARALRALRGPAPARRPGAPHSRGMATVAPHHPQSDHQATHRTRAGHAGYDPSDTRLLPAPGNPRGQPGTGIFTHLNRPSGLA